MSAVGGLPSLLEKRPATNLNTNERMTLMILQRASLVVRMIHACQSLVSVIVASHSMPSSNQTQLETVENDEAK